MTWLFETMDSVVPSGADFTSADVPTMPPAPGWFSTITGAPRAFDSAGDAARVIVSTPEAVATGRMNLMGRSLCAAATPAASAAVNPNAASAMRAKLRRRGDGGLFQSFVTGSLSLCGWMFGVVARSDRALCDERIDRIRRVADVAQQFAHVFADPGRIEAHAKSAPLQRDREQRRSYRFARAIAIGQAYIGESARRVQVNVIEEVLRTTDRRIGKTNAFEAFGEIVCTPVRKTRAQCRYQRRPRVHALIVGHQRRVLLEVGEAEQVAERLPLRVADGREENLFAVANGEHIVNRPWVIPRRHRRWMLAGHGVLQHVLAHQEHVVLE